MPAKQIIILPMFLVAVAVFSTALTESSLELNFLMSKCFQSLSRPYNNNSVMVWDCAKTLS